MLKVGLIGTGVALRTHLPGFQRTGQAEVVALVGSSQKRGAQFARQYRIPRVYADYQALCAQADIDLVVVASPNRFHFEQVNYALQQGKHVLAEKPLALESEDIQELIAMAANTQQLALIDHQLRFNPYMQAIQAHIQAGNLGRLYFIRFHFQGGPADPAGPYTWHFDDTMGGGVRLAMASHLLDLLWFWLGAPKVYSVHGRMDALHTPRKDADGHPHPVHTAGFFSAHLSLEDNLEVQMSDTMAYGEAQFTIAVYGTQGELYFTAPDDLLGAFMKSEGMQPIPIDPGAMANARPDGSIFRQSFDLLARRLVAAILSGEHSLVGEAAHFADAAPTQQVMDAMRASTLGGGAVELHEGYQPGARS